MRYLDIVLSSGGYVVLKLEHFASLAGILVLQYRGLYVGVLSVLLPCVTSAM